MSNSEYHDEANRIADNTFTPKVKNILRRLDDNGFRGQYTYVANFDTLTVKFVNGVVTVSDLSTPLTDEGIYRAIIFTYNNAGIF